MKDTSSAPLDYEVAISDEDYWESIEFALSEIRDLLNMRFETKIEAIGKPVLPPEKDKAAKWKSAPPIWNDPEAGGPVRAWNLLSYVDALDQIDVLERFEVAASLLASVERRISARELSPSFLHEWGLLNRYAGAIDLIYHSETDVGRLRQALAGRDTSEIVTDEHLRWYSFCFLYAEAEKIRLSENSKRKFVEDDVIWRIQRIIDGELELPSGYNVEWFRCFLGADGTLSWQFAQNRLSRPQMKKLVGKGTTGIPPIDLGVSVP